MRRPQQQRLHLFALRLSLRLPEPSSAGAERRRDRRRAGRRHGADGVSGLRERPGDRRGAERRDSGASGHRQPPLARRRSSDE